ncbi:tyrosine-type recombinase/integrase [Anaerotignum sp.]|uniref:tyrosine-type recombinase/integrase n=1 Tax=Anaerotignum sp. TaxID=2039241 RepID=UPI003FA4A4B3
MEKVEKSVTQSFLNEILSFYESIGNSIVPAIQMDIYFYSRGRKNNVMTTRAIQDAFHRHCKNANLPNTFTVHTLRHCFATHLLESSVEVCCIKELLGHTFIQTTSFYLL